MNNAIIVILLVFIAQRLWSYILEILNLLHMKRNAGRVPPEMAGFIDPEMLGKSAGYESDNTRFGIIEGLFSDAGTAVLIFAGLLDLYNSWMSGWGLPFIPAGIFYFLLLSWAAGIYGMPFRIYRTFRIEKKFGFNAMKPGLFAADFIKSMLIETAIIAALSAAGLWLVQAGPKLWWLFLWIFLFLFGIFLMYVSPFILDPLFNKYTPLDDEQLESKIREVLGRTGIGIGRVFKVDASKRSRHSNAYFTGIGRVKRIVIFDTLLEKLSAEEIAAVLAHEAGHWKKRHVLKTLAVNEITVFIGLYLGYIAINSDLLPAVFNIHEGGFFVKAVLAGFIAGLVMFFLSPLASWYSRKNEKEADRFAFDAMAGHGPCPPPLKNLQGTICPTLTPIPCMSNSTIPIPR